MIPKILNFAAEATAEVAVFILAFFLSLWVQVMPSELPCNLAYSDVGTPSCSAGAAAGLRFIRRHHFPRLY